MGKAAFIISEGLTLLKQPTHPAVLAPTFILPMDVLTLVTFQTKQDLEATTGMGAQYFQLIDWQCLSFGTERVPTPFILTGR